MSRQNDLIAELESALSSQDGARRADVLRRVTDLFVSGSGRFADDQIEVFDEVMLKLVSHIETKARAAFGSRLAKLPDAPPKVVRSLAFDDAVDVAGPVLEFSPRLDETTLAENAATKSQGHLFAIASRTVVTEPVTDVLVDRGDREVVLRITRNKGAKFSAPGMSKLTTLAGDDSSLALCIWARPDIPRQDILKLFASASEIVRNKLESADPRRAALIRTAVAESSEVVQATARAGSYDHSEAATHVRALHLAGRLNEARLLVFARERRFDRTAVALSLMCDVPLGPIERALVESERDQLLIIAKAIDLSWETTRALLTLDCSAELMPKERLDRWFASYFRLQPKSAKAALQFYRLQNKAKQAGA